MLDLFSIIFISRIDWGKWGREGWKWFDHVKWEKSGVLTAEVGGRNGSARVKECWKTKKTI